MTKPQQDYGVEVIRPFLQFSPGFVMFPTAIYREQLIRGKWVKPLGPPEDDKPSLDTLRQRKQPRLTRA